MKTYDVIVIGGGPAGLAAAISARKEGVSVAVLERADELGGILNQCIHTGFGLKYFGEELSGPEYAERFIKMAAELDIDCYLSAMVTDITQERVVTFVREDGLTKLSSKAVVLAMGCRERTRGAICIPGSRPAGIFTAGTAQRYTNIENLKPGNRAVILGSGDIGLIMARRFTLEGIEVEGVYELMPYANGLARNIKQCLDDFGIPLHLSTTVTDVFGNDRLTAVEVTEVDEKGVPIRETARVVECDTLLLSTGLIPENELSKKANVPLNRLTNGPVVDETLMTGVDGIFACGNVLHVHDLVDNVTEEAERAGVMAAMWAKGETNKKERLSVSAAGEVRYTVPSFIDSECGEAVVRFRVRRPVKNARLAVASNGERLYEGPVRSFKPSEMAEIKLTGKILEKCAGQISVAVTEVEQ